MFDYICGEVASKKVDSVTIDVNNIGYKIYISLNTFEKIGSDRVKLFIYNYVREDMFLLYGFYNESERDFFEKLIGISGVGAKLAIAILSTFNVKDLKQIIISEDIKLLTKVPGLGEKKGKKLILDIKDKLPVNLTLEDSFESKDSIRISELEENIYLALESLGYSNKDIDKFVDREKIKDYKNIEEAIKDILRKIQTRK
ncbi:MAG: Holliday junction branch migration protein RuvA [Fusobacteriaceae bacterium]|nr:Holliday junction branch migration protein RuvA [Fusobacteriaceae bacterium]MBN2838524.1 Holliday junction branch migration protein RuvA [Fusobacteriaceae bacterium]